MNLQIGLISFVLTGIAFILITIAILIDFLENHSNKNTRKEKKSFVETGTMFLFFFLFYFVVRFDIGRMDIQIDNLILGVIYLAWFILILGTYFNISGRFTLGKNWANQIKIYKNHTLQTRGVYSIVRHPLYASLIWIFYACSILYFNWIAFILNTVVFLPMMYYRAKQEEKLLSEQFKSYKIYQKKVGMFFPKW